jgi:hypothetical protein
MRGPAALALALALVAATRESAAWDSTCGCIEGPAPLGPAATFRLGAGVLKPAFGVRAGFDWLWERGQLGLEVELNPYFTLERVDVVLGSFNAAVTGGLRFRMNQGVTLRFEAGLGVSVLLFEAYGYPPGTPGVYLGARALGLDLDFGRRVLVGIDLVDLSLVAFRIADMPYLYPQWRVSVSVTLVRPRPRARPEAAPAEPRADEPDRPSAPVPAAVDVRGTEPPDAIPPAPTEPPAPVEPAPAPEQVDPPASARQGREFDSHRSWLSFVESRGDFPAVIASGRSASQCTS